MLGGVAYVLMGAGIPKAIPGILDQLAVNQPVELSLDVSGNETDPVRMSFDPREISGTARPDLTRPRFLAIISSTALATMLARRSSGRVDGFVVEGHTAGGHNAPPRGTLELSVHGEPVYGERDQPDLKAIRSLGLPFWLAGSYAGPEQRANAQQAGAVGVQVGTAFAYCKESDMADSLKARVLAASRSGSARVFTDPLASPTGFPFKVVDLTGTLSDASTVNGRERRCDLGYLRQAYRKPDGSIGWRCPAEPVAEYIRKGGDEKNTRGRLCVCNALLATIGLGQVRDDGYIEPPLVTSGDDVRSVARFLKPGAASYSAADVIDSILPPSKPAQREVFSIKQGEQWTP
jgi:nitronate monooxygenase